MNKFLILLAAISLLSCGESVKDYSLRAFPVSDSIQLAIETNHDVSTGRRQAWSDAIYDKQYKDKFVYDFNEALAMYLEDNVTLIEEIKNKKKKIDSLYLSLKEHPDESAELYNKIKELYSIYIMSYNCAVEPEGSLQSYTDELVSYNLKFKEIKNYFEVEKQ
ncbi:MAG: hypothetical protein V1779_12260 [bacterium]